MIFPFSLIKDTTTFPTSPLYQSNTISFSSLYFDNDVVPSTSNSDESPGHQCCQSAPNPPTSDPLPTPPILIHPPNQVVEPRKSSRVHKIPSHLKDYIHQMPQPTLLSLSTFFST